SRARRLPVLRPQARQSAPLLHGELPGLPEPRDRVRLFQVMRVVALLGHPVSHSLSPRMHNAAFAARGLDWTYVALDVEPDRLEDAVRGVDALGFAGANVTAPHKQAAAQILGSDLPSVNTLVAG